MAYSVAAPYEPLNGSPGIGSNMDTQEEKGTSDENRDSSGIIKDYKKWISELEYSKQTENDWYLESKDYWTNYVCESKKTSNFNILNGNVEILRQAKYNSLPTADIRRRFRDDDLIGKAVCDVLERGIDYENEEYGLDEDMIAAVLDHEVTGRGVTRVMYEPVIEQQPVLDPQTQQPVMQPKLDDEGAPILDAQGQPEQEPQYIEKKVDESCPTKQVQWNEFRRGPGKTWDEVPWVAFMHRLTKQEVEDQFGVDVADDVQFEEIEVDNQSTGKAPERTDLFQTMEAWEIWDKTSKHVYFVSISYDGYLKDPIEDPLHLKKFFPMPKPLYALENTTDLRPIPPYRIYKEQAIELNRASDRLNKLITAFRVRGMYAAQFEEVSRLLSANDLDMIPIQNAQGVEAAGGISGMIWIMPLADLSAAIDKLFEIRTQIISVIYQITGISDILRGTTTDVETAEAAKLKTQWGSLRLQRGQRAVQKYARDLMRIKAEIMCEHYDVSTLAAISGKKYPPTPAPQQPPMPGAPPPAPVADWQSIKAVMTSPQMRDVRIDVETDSTIQETIDRDMSGLAEVLTALTEFIKNGTPLVMAKALPFGAFKETVMQIIRRARMGPAIEDQFDQMTAPTPPPPPTPTQDELNQIRGAKDALIKVAADHTMQVQQQVTQATTAAQSAQADAAKAETIHQATTATVAQHQVNTATNEAMTTGLAHLGSLLAAQQAELTAIAKQIHLVVGAPKVVSFHKDDQGKIIGAAALPALPPQG